MGEGASIAPESWSSSRKGGRGRLTRWLPTPAGCCRQEGGLASVGGTRGGRVIDRDDRCALTCACQDYQCRTVSGGCVGLKHCRGEYGGGGERWTGAHPPHAQSGRFPTRSGPPRPHPSSVLAQELTCGDSRRGASTVGGGGGRVCHTPTVAGGGMVHSVPPDRGAAVVGTSRTVAHRRPTARRSDGRGVEAQNGASVAVNLIYSPEQTNLPEFCRHSTD